MYSPGTLGPRRLRGFRDLRFQGYIGFKEIGVHGGVKH